MPLTTAQFLSEQLELAEHLRLHGHAMQQPQDLPGRYGRVVKAIDRLLQAAGAEAVLAGGWAVWHHGFVGRVTQDVDVVLATDRVAEVLRVGSVSGFEILPRPPGRWPKMLHKETGIQVDILPEGERPGTPSRPAPTTLPHPRLLGAQGPRLHYITLPALIQLKLAAGRARDESDVVELIRANPPHVMAIREYLAAAHPDYVTAFDRLAQRASEQQDE